ncbi:MULTISPECIES: histidine--tRNA ligase [unclassified Brevibacterium]|uniref:histidine--tRNA ligase n=1 Tax=unclassified Brevibacterium TaxID=2614124 RepID=UPI001E3106A3|nr:MULTISPECIES: histidine--tRNA ligase [unclassified Brevibacterium]MCD1285017.1 histidine--tRNA ligase [Brevibacterium sp. CCUG 69071]MDK8435360.1 histidine--tRNA ligase [Brevibacterium sp. H-BE7]
MAKSARLSGFPERLPAERVIEKKVIDILEHTFALHGFSALNHRAVEPISQLAKDGEIDKEIFAVSRLHSEGAERSPLGLHFDLTVPLARYIADNANELSFPFKAARVQPVWRGERPQQGRYREFIQADIDVIADAELPGHFEVEIPLAVADAFARLAPLGVPGVKIVVNDRRLLEGFARGIGLENIQAVLRCLDKYDKIGPEEVAKLLATEAGATEEQQRLCLELAAIESYSPDFAEEVRALGVEHPLLDAGLDSLTTMLRAAHDRAPGVIVAQLKIARGLDYYTGAVYETQLIGYEELGSVASGGRYDSLATVGKKTYPGVGMSIGVSRLMAFILDPESGISATRGTPSAVVVAVTDEEGRAEADAVATALRARDIACEVSPSAAKFGKQIRYAERREIPFVWFTGGESGHEVKDIRSGEQTPADPQTWEPPEADLRPRVYKA